MKGGISNPLRLVNSSTCWLSQCTITCDITLSHLSTWYHQDHSGLSVRLRGGLEVSLLFITTYTVWTPDSPTLTHTALTVVNSRYWVSVTECGRLTASQLVIHKVFIYHTVSETCHSNSKNTQTTQTTQLQTTQTTQTKQTTNHTNHTDYTNLTNYTNHNSKPLTHFSVSYNTTHNFLRHKDLIRSELLHSP